MSGIAVLYRTPMSGIGIQYRTWVSGIWAVDNFFVHKSFSAVDNSLFYLAF